MRSIATSLLAFVLATPALADIDISAEIGKTGISATLETLEGLSRTRTEDEIFAIGGLRFLATIEAALQLQWRTGIGDMGNMLDIPILRLPVPPNPAPEPFKGEMISQLFADVDAGMNEARATLETLPDDADFALIIALDDLWFDINMNGTRDTREGAGTILGPQIMGREWSKRKASTPLPVVRFDGSDAAWLLAYTHLLSGISNSILTYDPAAAIDDVIATKAALGVVDRSVGTEEPYYDIVALLDAAVTIGEALRQTPNADRSRVAKAHFLQMIAQNRRFWTMVKEESDNDHEWIPNDHQSSALGLTLPYGTADIWLSVLTDAEALLEGRLLVPFWRGAWDRGVNLGKLFDNPQPGSLIGWVQGDSAVPYLEKGPLISNAHLRAFNNLMTENSDLMMIFLN